MEDEYRGSGRRGELDMLAGEVAVLGGGEGTLLESELTLTAFIEDVLDGYNGNT